MPVNGDFKMGHQCGISSKNAKRMLEITENGNKKIKILI